ncbi:MAG: Uma2 family endonuclease [Brasilonema octagenarum HA4186-MV1]|jgi:Uma2 family endonuclease|uniref:Uma2 family endonuclease n=2 Tax=Brasilonema TaxID=383614 RepID=A0A856ME07_9CYAN|nr:MULTISPECIES: Uma2 family endonuclease [Brasilonema]MBW4625496.1 Uma2 family endonuclease [Brasilonema octagenarum HA4186-MV1]NMF66718.1 Uma2 family endonuclease [Brasilonema octagenarum UFV-OR1]QDL07186.1 Uma2 family endonuclease [Brasilonema sennae CENA114]QDL13550.1 Uma2 family endonuclease [Brasilonema octagenarum UFV-E1]
MLSSAIFLRMPSDLQMTDEQFFEFCQVNRDLRIERDKFGEISIMPPTGSETGNRNFNVALQLGIWSEQNETGICFDSSTGFKLSTGADRSPDASWMKLERWNALSSEQQQRFAPICPDFVVELRSSSDNLQPLKDKMEEYMREPGIQLGWLIDRKHRKVYIYRPGMSEECLDNPVTVSGESVLPGFVLNMSKVW